MQTGRCRFESCPVQYQGNDDEMKVELTLRPSLGGEPETRTHHIPEVHPSPREDEEYAYSARQWEQLFAEVDELAPAIRGKPPLFAWRILRYFGRKYTLPAVKEAMRMRKLLGASK